MIVATGARPRTVDTPGAKLRNVHYLRCWMIPRPVSADRIANSAGFKTIRPGGISRNHSSAKNYELGFAHTSLRLRKMRSWSWSGNSIKPRTKAIVQMHHCLMAAQVCPLAHLKVTVTDFAALMVTEQAPVPVHAPLQPVKVDPAAALAVSVTTVPLLKLALQVVPQLIPVGLLVTVPVPVPALVTLNLKTTALNVAVTDFAALIVTLQVPVPVQAPLQPANVEPAAALPVSVTTGPLLKLGLQVAPQLIPVGLLVTVPVPVPALVTLNLKTTALNVAVTDFAALIVTLQVPVPVQAPLQPANVEPAAALAVSVTTVPLLKLALQVPEQLIPVGLLVTVPVVVPASETVSGDVVTDVLNVAVTDFAALIVTLQVPVPVHAPLQPAKVEPEPTAWVRVTTVPLLKFVLQVPGQLMPTGLLVTVPVPVPASLTVKTKLIPKFRSQALRP